MKLFYSKAACSMAPHIVLEELQLPHELEAVDLAKELPPYFLKANPMGAVPVLLMDNGEPLTEVAVIVQYLADLKPEKGLAPRPGTPERLRLIEWLNFIATEIHKGFNPLWAGEYMVQSAEAQAQIREFALGDLGRKFDVIVQKMGGRDFLMPSGYSVADAYLFTILNWTNFKKVDMARWPTLVSYMKRISERPATIRTFKAEHMMN